MAIIALLFKTELSSVSPPTAGPETSRWGVSQCKQA
jgi:hypothetical protein